MLHNEPKQHNGDMRTSAANMANVAL